ncbi:MAG: hypothetical protein AAFX87_30090 [Bacteroidota bacterium]
MIKKGSIAGIGKFKFPSKWQIGLAVGVNATFAYVLFLFFYYLSEGLRVSAYIFEEQLWMYAEDEALFQLIIVAAFSYCIAQGMFLLFFMKQTTSLGAKLRLIRRRVMQDQIFTPFMWLGYGVKVMLMYALMSLSAQMFYSFNLYDDYKWIFVALIVVLFLDQWKAIRLHFKSNTWKWMGISLAGLIIFSLTTGYVTYKKGNWIDEKYKATDPMYALAIELPERYGDRFNHVWSGWLTISVHVGYRNGIDNHDQFPELTLNKRSIGVRELGLRANEARMNVRESEQGRITVKILIDRDVKFKHVEQVLARLRMEDFRKYVFATIPEGSSYSEMIHNNSGLNVYLTPFCKDLSIKYKELIRTGQIENTDIHDPEYTCFTDRLHYLASIDTKTIIQTDSLDNLYYNGELVDENELYSKIQDEVTEAERRGEYVFVLKTNPEASYDGFIKAHHYAIKAIEDIRRTYVAANYRLDYDKLHPYDPDHRPALDYVRKTYPLNVVYLNTAEAAFVEYMEANETATDQFN